MQINPFQYLKDKYINQGYQDGYENGYDTGYQEAINDFNKNVNKYKHNNSINKNDDDFDTVMLWLSSIIEIKDTQFFKHIYFSQENSKKIKEILDFIITLEYYDYSSIYPYVYYYLPELKEIFSQIYNNKIITEQAERIK